MDIVFHLAILMGAALLTGNFALKGLARKYNSKENHEKTE
jgi:hypothetical protein